MDRYKLEFLFAMVNTKAIVNARDVHNNYYYTNISL